MSWIETSNGNRISKDSTISGSNRILLSGNTTVHAGVVLKGDVPLASQDSEKVTSSIQIGKYSYLNQGCIIEPPVVSVGTTSKVYGPVRIGSYVIVGTNTEISSASIGNRVLIEDNCKLGNLSIIYDCCYIREGCVVPPRTVIPPFSEVSGTPGIDFAIKSLNNSYRKLIEVEAREKYILG
ncbi:hypothetical protein CAAN1_05S02168 [[Candida] anglica]|uniref:Dynactin subunit 5 n=1 Tax=[Candida] anglica TaxID=148631 RepID=A0ABP0ECW4_9ASCO